jgi:hypothetical protein
MTIEYAKNNMFLFSAILTDPTPSFEQLTADYFFETIWKEKYGNYRSIEFENKTDTSIYAGNVHGCGEWDEADKIEIAKGKTKEQIQLHSKPPNVSIKRKSNSKRLKLTIGTKARLGDAYVVQIIVYEPFEFVNHYFIKFDKDGKIIGKCEFNEII